LFLILLVDRRVWVFVVFLSHLLDMRKSKKEKEAETTRVDKIGSEMSLCV